MDERERQAVHVSYLMSSIWTCEKEAMEVSRREEEFLAKGGAVEREELTEIFEGQRYMIRMFGNVMTTLLFREIGTRQHAPEAPEPGAPAPPDNRGFWRSLKAALLRWLVRRLS